MNNPFWDYSLRAYRIDGVAEHCLALQDEQHVDVNVLLYAAWLGSANLQLTPSHLRALEFQVANWRDTVVRPLRQLRRTLKGRPSAYADVKALELTAERQQQDTMYRHFQGSGCASATGAMLDNLTLVAGSGEGHMRDWNQRVQSLSQLLSGVPGGGGAAAERVVT